MLELRELPEILDGITMICSVDVLISVVVLIVVELQAYQFLVARLESKDDAKWGNRDYAVEALASNSRYSSVSRSGDALTSFDSSC